MTDRLTVSVVPVTPLRQNCAVLVDPASRRAVISDPGGDVARILGEVAAQDLVVEAIVLTHGHADHVCGAAGLREALGARQGREVPVLGPAVEDLPLLEVASALGAEFGIADAQAVVPDRYLRDGEVLDLLGRAVEVRHVPGHAPGHVVFVFAEDRLVVAGDTLFRGVIGRTDFAYGDHHALLKGIRDKLLTLPDDMAVLPGHGMPTTIGAERADNPFLQNLDTPGS